MLRQKKGQRVFFRLLLLFLLFLPPTTKMCRFIKSDVYKGVCTVIQWIALAFGIVLNAAANILLKMAARHAQEMDSSAHLLVKLFLNPYLFTGILSFGLALGAYSYSLTRFPLSVGYPLMTSLGLIIVSLFSYFVFAEQFSAGKIAGTVLIMLGVLLVARSA